MRDQRRVLFVCSGNYYRSRFAEILFNHVMAAQHSPWRAFSRGLKLWDGNVGPISPFAVAGLRLRGIATPDAPPPPQWLTETDLQAADVIVAVKESEHRPMMAAQFPGWVDRVEYWAVDDLDVASAEDALPGLDAQVRALAMRLNGQT